LNRRQLIIEPGFLQVDTARSAGDRNGAYQLLSGADVLKAYAKLTATKKTRRKSVANRKQFARATMSCHSLTSVNWL
jgi:hypothetical protein